jgi:hypothetical protein
MSALWRLNSFIVITVVFQIPINPSHNPEAIAIHIPITHCAHIIRELGAFITIVSINERILLVEYQAMAAINPDTSNQVIIDTICRIPIIKILNPLTFIF